MQSFNLRDGFALDVLYLKPAPYFFPVCCVGLIDATQGISLLDQTSYLGYLILKKEKRKT